MTHARSHHSRRRRGDAARRRALRRGGQRRHHRGGGGAGHARGERDARHRRDRQDRDPGRHRPARAYASPVDPPRRHAAHHQRSGPRRRGGAVGRHHDADRFRLLARGRRPRGDRVARQGLRRQKLMRLGLSPDGVIRSAGGPHGRTRRGDPGRLPDGEDIHHQYPAEPAGPHGRLRRHLGNIQSAGCAGRSWRHPCRGQRPRHAHVRQADRRAASRLRKPRRSAHAPRST
jgi:hypothetical protein